MGKAPACGLCGGFVFAPKQAVKKDGVFYHHNIGNEWASHPTCWERLEWWDEMYAVTV